MAQLTKLSIQNFGEFGNNTEIEFNKITLVSNQFPITLVKNMILSFFDTDVIVDKIELKKYIIKDNPIIISLPFSFLHKENLILKYQYDNDGELSSFKIIDKEKMVTKTPNRRRIEKEEAIVELTKKRIFIDFILLQKLYYTYFTGLKEEKYDKGHWFEPANKVKYPITFSTISSLRGQIKDYMNLAGTVFDNRIYESLKVHIKSIEQILGNIKTVSTENSNEIEGIGLNNNEIPFIEITDDDIISLQNNISITLYRSKIIEIGNTIANFSKKYPERNIIIYTNEVIINDLKNVLVKHNISDKDVNIYKVVKKSTSLVLFPSEQTKLKSENIELEKDILSRKLKVSNDELKDYIKIVGRLTKKGEKLQESKKKLQKNLYKKQNIVDNFNKQLSIETYNEAMLLGEMGLSKQSIILSDKISNNTIQYLSSAKYLMANMGNNSDYSPVVLQYGRAVENELMNLFNGFAKSILIEQLKEIEIYLSENIESLRRDKQEKKDRNTKFIKDKISDLLKKLEYELKKDLVDRKDLQLTFIHYYCFLCIASVIDTLKLSKNLHALMKCKFAIFPFVINDFKGLNEIVNYRNDAAHAGNTLTSTQAEKMDKWTIEFFRKWIFAKN